MVPQDPRDADVEEINAKLSESLATCRTVVQDYRVALASSLTAGGEPAPAGEAETAAGEPG